ncbi:MAG: diguanylate cyclase [Deltaproteobacteria bacterium]|nr:diguanylate cyclase [Deltaproteobacteria bacterium]
MLDSVLIIEDSWFAAKLLRRVLQSELRVECVVASTYAEAVEHASRTDFLAALVDLTLPDAPPGAAVDLLADRGYPVVVVTAELSDAVQQLMWKKRVAEYLVKDELFDPRYLVAQIGRFQRNRDIEVLVVDDSPMIRGYTAGLLRRHRYQVIEASKPSEALEVLERNPRVRMAITDYNMPEMDGCALTRLMRRDRAREEFVIIGISAQGSAEVSARFIKSGANDFMHKPFSPDEFYCRVGQNITMLESIRAIREASLRDFMTGLYNRRHFYDVGKAALDRARKARTELSLAMLDVDKFKAVNDSHGHDAGDAVLRAVATLIAEESGAGATTFRLGGEEFCVLVEGAGRQELGQRLEHLRAALEAKTIPAGDKNLRVTASFGGTSELHGSLDDMLRAADQCLYQAKDSGRNRVVLAGSVEPARAESHAESEGSRS